MTLRNRSPLALSVGIALLGAYAAHAGVISQTVFTIEATNASGSATLPFNTGLVYNPATNQWDWVLPAAQDLEDPDTGAVIASITSANISYIKDPKPNKWYSIAMGFQISAGTSDTHFRIHSGLVGLAPDPNKGARSTATLGVTDQNGNGVTLQGWGPFGTGAYTAQYNGYAPSGTTFANLVNLVQAASGSAGASGSWPVVGTWEPIPGIVNDMSLLLDFSLTAGDAANGTESYRVQIPEPTAALAFLVGCVAAFARRRSC